MYSIELNGAGLPLVMLHGWGHTHASLIPLGELLSPFVRPYLVDLPGFGRSAAPDTVWSAEDYARALSDHLEAHGIREFYLFGHSFGGKVALCLAKNHPKKVKKLVLAASAGLRPRRTLANRVRILSILYAGKGVKWWDRLRGSSYFETTFIPKFGSADYRSAGSMRSILIKSVHEDYTPILSEVEVDTLLLWGEKDTETPLEIGQRFAQGLPRAKLISFAHHGHLLFEDVGAHLCARYMHSFLAEEQPSVH